MNFQIAVDLTHKRIQRSDESRYRSTRGSDGLASGQVDHARPDASRGGEDRFTGRRGAERRRFVGSWHRGRRRTQVTTGRVFLRVLLFSIVAHLSTADDGVSSFTACQFTSGISGAERYPSSGTTLRCVASYSGTGCEHIFCLCVDDSMLR